MLILTDLAAGTITISDGKTAIATDRSLIGSIICTQNRDNLESVSGIIMSA